MVAHSPAATHLMGPKFKKRLDSEEKERLRKEKNLNCKCENSLSVILNFIQFTMVIITVAKQIFPTEGKNKVFPRRFHIRSID